MVWRRLIKVSDFRPCRECKDWKACLLTESEKDWFGYEHIRFCPQQIFWLLRYERIIRGKRWPVPDNTVLGGMGGQVLSEATFTKVSLILAELYARLESAGTKGELLSSQCKEPERDKLQYLDDKVKDVLYYVAGDKRKQTSFPVWLAKRRYKKYTRLEKCRS
jgi:hypothetical protein